MPAERAVDGDGGRARVKACGGPEPASEDWTGLRAWGGPSRVRRGPGDSPGWGATPLRPAEAAGGGGAVALCGGGCDLRGGSAGPLLPRVPPAGPRCFHSGRGCAGSR